jgi:hypothetical protein|tara:strand:+ start:1751 stop:2128 length:378 start_codon:yes stop_codon:yes gene_type:complete
MSKKKYARRVAMALCKANTLAGIPWEGEHFEEETSKCLLTLTQRAENLLKEVGSYGAYVVEGDPSQWSGGSLCTIYMEPKGGPGDVLMPLDYWGTGFEVAERASDILGDVYIEFVNPAVAAVWEA